MAITSRRDIRVPAVCLLLLAGAFITSHDPSLTALASPSCTTSDPFVALGGGVCLNGGWVPKGMVPDGQVPPPPVTAPLPSAPAAPSTCSTPDPFVALGGGVCHDGGWLPPGIVPPISVLSPAPPVPTAPPVVIPPPVDTAGTCSTPDPFASLGGGTCHQGGWLPPGALAPPPAGAPVVPPPPPPATPPVEIRVTGTVRQQDGRPFIESGNGVRYFFADGGSGIAPFTGSVVTVRGLLSRPASGGTADLVITSPAVRSVLAISIPSPGSGASLVDDRLITVRTAGDVTARRAALIDFVWGSSGFPQSEPPAVLRADSSPVPGLENLQSVDTLVMEMDEGRAGYAHHFTPRRSNNRAVILHHGHACTFDDDTGGADSGLGMARTLNALLVHGYSVVAVYMPNHARFSTTQIEVDDCAPYTHYGMFSADTGGSGSPLRFFLTPAAMAVNYLRSGYSYDDVSMVGLSGGGWTTAVYAAIDPRITTSVQVGGTLPFYLQRPDLPGDSEQVHEPFYRLTGFPELYVLGSAGAGRRQLQILNRRDDCCFSERQSNVGAGAPFDAAVRGYERDVRGALTTVGSGAFRVEVDEAAPGHMISWNSVLNLILPELNRGVPHVAAASADVAFVRGLNGNLWQFAMGTWRDTGLPMVGTAAVVANAVHAYDLFYRSPSNRLMHGYPVGTSWEARDLGVVVLSDPGATSWGPGRFDVVSIDTLYRPVHWWSDGGPVQSRVITSTEAGLAIGRPALVTSGPGRLHLFAQGRFDRALHSMQLRPDLSWSTDVLASTMLDAPGAVVDGAGNVRAYFRGASNALWEAANVSGVWEWTHVTSAAGGRLIRGTPSASLADGAVTVHALTTTGLATFRLTDQWTAMDASASLSGSPTSTGGVAHVIGSSQDLWLHATGWIWRGRPPQ